jgi:hypothetical protein
MYRLTMPLYYSFVILYWQARLHIFEYLAAFIVSYCEPWDEECDLGILICASNLDMKKLPGSVDRVPSNLYLHNLF